MTRDRKQCLRFACGEDAEKQSVREEEEKKPPTPVYCTASATGLCPSPTLIPHKTPRNC